MVFELLWRDFFKYIALKYGSKLFHVNGCIPQGALKYQWKIDPVLFDSWCKGETGYPFVDANMKELNETGFMSNRGRQNVASFLTKDLEIGNFFSLKRYILYLTIFSRFDFNKIGDMVPNTLRQC